MFKAQQYSSLLPHFLSGKSEIEIYNITGMPVEEIRIHKNQFEQITRANKKHKQRAQELRNYFIKTHKEL